MQLPPHGAVLSLVVVACLMGLGCDVYDDELMPPVPTLDSGGTSPPTDACTASVELCNGEDDDCDGDIDEEAAALMDCSTRVRNAPSTCEKGFCVRTAGCHNGFYNCDGKPDNGCESPCPCTGSCDDAGPGGRDAGPEAEDAGPEVG